MIIWTIKIEKFLKVTKMGSDCEDFDEKISKLVVYFTAPHIVLMVRRPGSCRRTSTCLKSDVRSFLRHDIT
jgi:hypothetical protein